LDYVAVIKLVFLAPELNFLPNKLGEPIWEFLVDDLVEFLRTLKRQSERFGKLSKCYLAPVERIKVNRLTPSISNSSVNAVELGPLTVYSENLVPSPLFFFLTIDRWEA